MKKFTLVEILFVICILVILIGIGLASGSKIMRKSAAAKAKAEIKLIDSAISAYKLRWGQYPKSSSDSIDFVEWLSKISPHAKDELGRAIPRSMLIDCLSTGMDVSNKRYFMTLEFNVNLKDVYGQDYAYTINDGAVKIVSLGHDGKIGTEDDISN